MVLRSPLVITVYDKDFAYRGLVTRPLAVTATARDYALTFAPGTASVTVDADDEIAEDLRADGARLVIEYRPDPEEDPHRLVHHVGGAIDSRSGGDHTLTVTVVDDDVFLGRILGVPVPAGSLATGQGSGAYTVTGPAETVVKSVASANLGDLGVPLTVAPDLGRGDTISAAWRMQAVMDKLPGLPYAMVSVRVRQVGSGLVLDARTPTTHTVPITERSGLVSGSWSIKAPDFTRVIVAGGEVSGVTKFRRVINAAAEAKYGGRGYGPLVSATDTTSDAVMDARGWESLNAAGERASLSVELAESEEWRYAVTCDLGDVLPIQMNGAPVPIEDRVREVEITLQKSGAVLPKPRVGEQADRADQVLASSIKDVARAQRVDRAGRV